MNAPEKKPTSNLEKWEKLSTPPSHALKEIQAGRLRGKTDINPQWRYKAMTEAYGPCGTGWRYEIARTWTEPIQDGQVCVFVEVRVSVRDKPGGEWSAPIPGIGGSKLIDAERSGLYVNDEAYKMATTDALSVSLKMLGVASSIYEGLWDGTKYRDPTNDQPLKPMTPLTAGQRAAGPLTVLAVTGKPGKSKTGKDYMIFTVELSNGSSPTTFSETIAQKANAAMEMKAPVEVEVERNQYGLKLKSLNVFPAPGEPDPVPPPGDSDLPF